MKKPFVKRWLEKLEATAAAVAFAEEGEAETARKLLEDGSEAADVERRVRPGPPSPVRGVASPRRSRG